jgi:hypothetical protein
MGRLGDIVKAVKKGRKTERRLETEAAARAKLMFAYERFMAEEDPAKNTEAGEDLIRAIFGRAAIAEDPRR